MNVQVVDACRGLAYLHHQLSKVHRDIKPANILLDSITASKAVIADFGLVRDGWCQLRPFSPLYEWYAGRAIGV